MINRSKEYRESKGYQNNLVDFQKETKGLNNLIILHFKELKKS